MTLKNLENDLTLKRHLQDLNLNDESLKITELGSHDFNEFLGF